jgi:glutaconate CoA-transferase subunit A
MSLEKAVTTYVTNGCHISIGGFTVNRNPMAAVYEIMRQRVKGLHLYAHSNGQGVDELIGADCVARIEIAYSGSGLFATTCIRFRQAVEKGEIEIEDYSNFQMTLRFMAGAMGVPFLPTRSGLGSDISAIWGFDAKMRKADPRIPNQKLVVLDNPFNDISDTKQVVLVPAITPDVTIIHVQQAEAGGTARICGLPFADVEQVKAAKHVIITCEEVLPNGALRDKSDLNQIAPFCVDAVVPVKMGAYPTACYGCYDYDPVYLKKYAIAAKDEQKFNAYLQKFVYGLYSQEELIKMLPVRQINAIKADPQKGYALNLERKKI